MVALFRRIASAVGNRLGYAYPLDLEQCMVRYLTHVKQMGHKPILALTVHGAGSWSMSEEGKVAKVPSPMAIYLEVGQKRALAGAIEWPGWCRGGRDEASAIAALVAYGPRYAKVFSRTQLAFTPPDDPGAFTVAERLDGNSATDFGVPNFAPKQDTQPFDEAERERSEAILAAIWRAFDRAVDAAEGWELRKGPRGGGRDRDKIVRHVLGADASYLRSLGQRFSHNDDAPLRDELKRTRAAIRAALVAAERGDIAEAGPRGGKIWLPRYYVRRVAWHTLDHAWEIEDRIV